jgi:hypothetical protein
MDEQQLQAFMDHSLNVLYDALRLATQAGNRLAVTDIEKRIKEAREIRNNIEMVGFEMGLPSLGGNDLITPDDILNDIYQFQRQVRILMGVSVPYEREDFERDLAEFRAQTRGDYEEARRQRREAEQDRLNKPPSSNPFSGLGIRGGKLSAPELKGLLDASYDSKVKKVGDFEMDKQLSSSTSKVYRNPVTGQVVVAHRGTAGISDWGNNALYAIGGKRAYKLTPRYKEAEKVQRRAVKKYGADSVTTIGHSQGGLQSELLGGRSKEIITLNKATLPFESNTNKNQYDIRSERDVVSGLNPFARKSKKDVDIKAKTYNPLTEHSGDVLDRLGKNKVIGKGVYLKGYERMRGGASRGRQPTRQPRDEEDSPSPEPPPLLDRQIVRRLREIMTRFERDAGSVTFLPDEREALIQEYRRLSSQFDRIPISQVVIPDIMK